MDEIIRNVIESLDISINKESKHVQYSSKDYIPINFSIDNFQPINPQKGKIAFIDGGNCEILSSVNFSLQFFRIYYCVFDGKMVDSGKEEFFGLVSSIGKDKDIFYETKLFGSSLKIPLINSKEDFMSNGNVRGKVSKVADIIRRLAEIKISEKINSDYIVLDGNLKADNDFIKEAMFGKKLYALSKTNELFTDSGNSLCVELNVMSPIKSWYYYPLVKIKSSFHDADVVIAKFHSKSKYVFKLETPKDDDLKIVDVIAFNSKDPVFLGYPYGLIKADKFARVSNNEKEYFKIKFLSNIKDKEKITQYLNTINAHDILDNIL